MPRVYKKKQLEITKEQLETLLQKGYGENKVCKELSIGPAAYRRHIQAYGLKSIHGILDNSKISELRPKCSNCNNKCEVDKKICRSCTSKCKIKSIKLYLINFKGGKCEKCGYCENSAALEFHHIKGKDFQIGGNYWNKNDLPLLIQEIEKCLLLCSNCHKKEHQTFGVGNIDVEETINRFCKELENVSHD